MDTVANFRLQTGRVAECVRLRDYRNLYFREPDAGKRPNYQNPGPEILSLNKTSSTVPEAACPGPIFLRKSSAFTWRCRDLVSRVSRVVSIV